MLAEDVAEAAAAQCGKVQTVNEQRSEKLMNKRRFRMTSRSSRNSVYIVWWRTVCTVGPDEVIAKFKVISDSETSELFCEKETRKH